MAVPCDHGQVAFVSNLCSGELTTILELLPKRGCNLTDSNNASVIIIVSQNHILVSPSPLTQKFEENLVRKNVPSPDFSGDIKNRLNADRKIILIKRGRKTALLNKAEEISIVESKVKRGIFSKETELRRLDSKFLIKLLEKAESSSIRRSQSRIPECVTSKVHHVSQRTVKPVKCNQAPLVYSVAPGRNDSFKNPSFPNKDKLPIQATQDDEDALSMDMASMATSAQYRYSRGGSSFPSTAYSFRGSGMTYGSSEPSTSYYSSGASNYSFGASSSQTSVQEDARSTQSSTPPRYVNYMNNDSRLATFNSPKWMVNEKPDKYILVEQGFFFTGRDDLVRCFQCGIGLKDWIRSDDVMTEHRKYSPTCSLLPQKTETAEGNSGNSPVRTGNQTSYKVRSPQYQTMESRIRSFDRFPSIIGIPPQQLAVAGLFFTGDGDLCRCFTCDGGLKDWSSGDDPCKEHATYFPKCSYINQLKGADYVREMQRRRENNMQSTDAASDSSTQTSTATTSTSSSSPATANLSIPSMDGPNISGNLNSSSIDSQVKEIGFSDTQVKNARAELRRRGVANPSVEALMNAILDMPETTNAGEETANSRQETSNARQDTPDSRQSTTNTTSEGELRPKDLRKLAEENQQLSKQVQCMLCVKEEPDILFLPCAHHRICHNCSERISRCPQCNTVIKEKVRTYRA